MSLKRYLRNWRKMVGYEIGRPHEVVLADDGIVKLVRTIDPERQYGQRFEEHNGPIVAGD